MVLVTWSDARRFCEWRRRTIADEEPSGNGPPEAFAGDAIHGAMSTILRCESRSVCFGGLDATDGFLELAKVGSFPDGRTPEGIDDLAGNAEEWVADWFAPGIPTGRASSIRRDPTFGDFRVCAVAATPTGEHGSVERRGARFRRPSANDDGFRCVSDPLKDLSMPQVT